MDLKNIGVIIPAYNVETTVGRLIDELIDYGFNRENIIVVNDASTDRTQVVLENAGVHMVSHEKNLGKGAALRHGIHFARRKNFKKVITLDADGQHKVSEIKNFLKKNNAEVMIGHRQIDLVKMPFQRKIVNKTVSLVTSLLSNKYIPDAQCGFRFIDLKIFDKVNLKANNFQTESELVIKTVRNNYGVAFVPITTVYGEEKSHINPLIDTIRFINMAVRCLWR
jgi:glycosyltransferase involved in cell wall biosynthesis